MTVVRLRSVFIVQIIFLIVVVFVRDSSSVLSSNVTCSRLQWKCDNGDCIDELRKCDGDNDCADGSDEICHGAYCDEETHFRCSTGECIERSMVCDQSVDCFSDEDEEHCDGDVCPAEKFKCTNGRCIPKSWQCDGRTDCSDGIDENNCSKVDKKCKADHFMCKDSLCIPKEFICDGQNDCSNDEEGCGDGDCLLSRGHFKCENSSQCLGRNLVCNDHFECSDHSEENGKCGIPCSSISCQQDCFPTPYGPKCICESGFNVGENGLHCEDINECEGEILVCDHYCHNEVGSFICSCADGYDLLNDNVTCRTPEPALMLFTFGHSVTAKLLDNTESWSVWHGEEEATGVAYDPIEETVYWVANSDFILRKKLRHGNKPELFIKGGLRRPENLAVDWIGRNIYVTDFLNNHILACGIESKTCLPILTQLSRPRALQLDLEQRKLYWTELEPPMIRRSNLDGTVKQTVIETKKLGLPNGLALDVPASRLYWADAKLDTIENSDYDGGKIKKVPETEISHSFALAIWQDRIYWTDWQDSKRFEIHSCRKRNGKSKRTEFKNENNRVQNLVIYHESMFKKAQNPCKLSFGAGCSHLCLLTSSNRNGFVCACPKEMTLAKDGFTCHENSRFPPFVAVQSELYVVRRRNFGEDSVELLENENLKLGIVSDIDYNPQTETFFIADSKNGEISTLKLPNRTVKKLLRNIGRPISIAVDWVRENLYWINENHKNVEVARTSGEFRNVIIKNLMNPTSLALDVKGGWLFVSDSSRAPSIIRCELGGSRCKSLVNTEIRSPMSISFDDSVVPGKLYWTDLQLGTIERVDFNGEKRKKMIKDLYQPISVVINDNDIIWAEEKSNILKFRPKENSTNVHYVNIEIEALNGQWSMALTIMRPKEVFIDVCFSEHRCHQLCYSRDNTKMECGCAHGLVLDDDDVTCNVEKCKNSEWQCDDKTCIWDKFRCDNNIDCGDGSDEKGCSVLKVNCTEEQFSCSNGHCINENEKCDGYEDCLDGSDEKLPLCRTARCTHVDEFKCSSGECIPRIWRCNNKKDCKDDSDEENCELIVCLETERKCNNGRCFSSHYWCDGDKDCPNGDDEKDCPCRLGEYKCQNGVCLDESKLCSGEMSCEHETVKLNCSTDIPKLTHSFEVCPINYLPCNAKVGSDKHCVPSKAWCNGTAECLHNEDETDCPKSCPVDYVKCKGNDYCIPKSWTCDEIKDCEDGSDEYGCGSTADYYSPVACKDDEFACTFEDKCIPQSKVCDGHRDCVHGTDEDGTCDKCSDNNGGCEQLCLHNPTKVICSCSKGFTLSSDGISCKDIDECVHEDPCHHLCENRKGTFTCSCDKGYSLREDGVTCKPSNGEQWMVVAAHNGSLRYLDNNLRSARKGILKTTPFLTTLLAQLIYDPRDKKFLAIDGAKGIIYKESNDSKWIMKFSNFENIKASSLDYVNNNLYISEVKIVYRNKHSKDKLVIGKMKVCNLESKYCGQLFTLSNAEITAVKVSPLRREIVMCVNDYNGNGRITARKLDGSSLRYLVDQKIIMCKDLVVDEMKKRVYWIDGVLHRIESVDVLGYDRQTFFTNEVHNANGLALLDHSLLWFNKRTLMLVKCSKSNPKDCVETFFSKEIYVADVQPIYDMSIKTPCLKKTCPHLCVPFSLEVHNCICSEGFTEEKGLCVPVIGETKVEVKGNCSYNPCETGTCETTSPGVLRCRCPDGFMGKYCEVSFEEKSNGVSRGLIAFVVIILIALVLLVFYYRHKISNTLASKNSPYKLFRSGNKFFRSENSSFGLMMEEECMQPQTPPIPRFVYESKDEALSSRVGSTSNDAAIPPSAAPRNAYPNLQRNEESKEDTTLDMSLFHN